jgi:hypothetical protein
LGRLGSYTGLSHERHWRHEKPSSTVEMKMPAKRLRAGSESRPTQVFRDVLFDHAIQITEGLREFRVLSWAPIAVP